MPKLTPLERIAKIEWLNNLVQFGFILGTLACVFIVNALSVFALIGFPVYLFMRLMGEFE